MISVLIVEDEPRLQRALVMNLAARGYLVTAASSGRSALEHLRTAGPDLMILDLGLPDVDGLDVIRSCRGRTPLPIIVLSARTGSQDKIDALELGASDYVTKPFDVNELVARLRATTRQSHLAEPPRPRLVGDVTVDLTARTATGPAGTSVHLTPTEWRMREVLLRRPGALIGVRCGRWRSVRQRSSCSVGSSGRSRSTAASGLDVARTDPARGRWTNAG